MNKLKKARVLADKSQIQLAKESGVSLYRLQVCERGWQSLRKDEIKLLAKPLNVKPKELEGE